ncbi:MAG: hypothetical protein JW909_14000 [Planctomycetes bacterium]|nr:hypothetical protein [Planctomycetota bacterium]
MNNRAPRTLEWAGIIFLAAAQAAAGEAAPAAGGSETAVKNAIRWTLSLDPFTLTLAFLVVATVIGTLLKGRARDRCYKRMQRFNVRLGLDDRTVAGRLSVGNAGMEVLPDEPEQGPFGKRTGFILPKAEYGRVRSLVRLPDRMQKKWKNRREGMIRRVTNPGIARRTGRGLSNLAGSFKDAFGEFFNLMMGRLNAGLGAIKSQQTYVSRMQGDMLSSMQNTNYDATIEKLRGKRVEVELNIPGMPPRVAAILDDYTAQNISLFDARLPVEKTSLKAVEENGAYVINNTGGTAAIAGWGKWEEIPAGGKLKLEGAPPEGATVYAVERADVIFPRTNAQIRYRLET